ncbi:NADH-quinone oxidoreductase subunit NuoH [Ponticaulis profundi]|uniref:NADH-quinone oxidoreductase subunit H n=1 Tax=Ponticaulis profundi TaxID=2665222 RepID=A0ABW1SE39_9PROT
MQQFLAWTNDNALLAVLLSFGQIILISVVLLLAIAYLLYFDRKVLAGTMLRKGPNVVGPWGLLQSFADFGKFLIKETVIPAGANKAVFLIAPILSTVLPLICWAVVPIAPGWVVSDLNVGILYILAMSSLGVYGVIMAGWASNSKYPFLGGLRSAAQMVSYEVSIGFVLVTVILLSGSMNLATIVESQNGGFWNWYAFKLPTIIVMFPMMIIFFISALAETNRPPFDLPEAESELVAGYQVEYSGTPFLLIYLGEQVAITLMCAMTSILFLGGWNSPIGDLGIFEPGTIESLIGAFWFALKTLFVFFMFAFVRALVPRYRYDQLMRLGWKIFLPTSLVAVLLIGGFVAYSNALSA